MNNQNSLSYSFAIAYTLNYVIQDHESFSNAEKPGRIHGPGLSIAVFEKDGF
ncbi:hypothetical protein R52603_02453 [Paraburkholderia saeva]|nr:hypothetical protein R70241_01002 [Paraburkholderia saeva]CAG4898407.1 hypothetical protein R52603_02453 [Paraburkholderia saeva]